jgi:hypothetical protein
MLECKPKPPKGGRRPKNNDKPRGTRDYEEPPRYIRIYDEDGRLIEKIDRIDPNHIPGPSGLW